MLRAWPAGKNGGNIIKSCAALWYGTWCVHMNQHSLQDTTTSSTTMYYKVVYLHTLFSLHTQEHVESIQCTNKFYNNTGSCMIYLHIALKRKQWMFTFTIMQLCITTDGCPAFLKVQTINAKYRGPVIVACSISTEEVLIKLIICNAILACRVDVCRSGTFPDNPQVHCWLQPLTTDWLSGRQQVVLATFPRFRKPPHSCTDGICHSSKHSSHVLICHCTWCILPGLSPC